MTKTIIPGGWYADVRPGGAYAVLLKGKGIQTRFGLVPLPTSAKTGTPQGLLWLVLSPDGVSFAGTGADDDLAWLWDGVHGGWSSRPCFACPRACIFLPNGVLHVVANPTETGSQGYIQVADDGHLVKTDSQYADVARHLYEYTVCGDVRIGQGGDGPDGQDPIVVLLPDGSRRLLQTGTCRAIRAHRVANDFAIAWSQQDKNAAGLWFGTLADLQALPKAILVTTTPPVPAPTTGPWKVTFDESYTKTIARGAGAVARCAIGNGIDVEWQKGADDTIHFAVYKNGVLQDRSGTARHVEIVG